MLKGKIIIETAKNIIGSAFFLRMIKPNYLKAFKTEKKV